MACADCGHDTRHVKGCGTYVPLVGWCGCLEYAPGRLVAAPAVILAGRATARKLFTDTQAFRDKAVADAAAKKRKWR